MTEDGELRFLLSSKLDNFEPRGLTITAHPVTVSPAGEIRNISSSSFRPDPLSDFIVRARADANAELGDTYGWTREYSEVYSVDTERAAIMLKQLRALDRGMERLEHEFGFVSDFPTYLARVASLLKIRTYGWKVGEHGAAWAYAGNEYKWGDATYMGSWVQREITEFRAKAVSTG